MAYRTGLDIFNQTFQRPDWRGLSTLGAGIAKGLEQRDLRQSRERELLLARAQELGFNSIEEMNKAIELQGMEDAFAFMDSPEGMAEEESNLAAMADADMVSRFAQMKYTKGAEEVEDPRYRQLKQRYGDISKAMESGFLSRSQGEPMLTELRVAMDEAQPEATFGEKPAYVAPEIQVAMAPESSKTQQIKALKSALEKSGFKGAGDFRLGQLKELAYNNPQAFAKVMYDQKKGGLDTNKLLAVSSYQDAAKKEANYMAELEDLQSKTNLTQADASRAQALTQALEATRNDKAKALAMGAAMGVPTDYMKFEDMDYKRKQEQIKADNQLRSFNLQSRGKVGEFAEKARDNIQQNGAVASLKAVEDFKPLFYNNTIISNARKGSASDQRALVMGFSKVLAPAEAVMEGDARAAAAQGFNSLIERLKTAGKIALDQDGNIAQIFATLTPEDVDNLVRTGKTILANTESTANTKVAREQQWLDAQVSNLDPSGKRFDLGLVTTGKSTLNVQPMSATTVEDIPRREIAPGVTVIDTPEAPTASPTITGVGSTDPFPEERAKLPPYMEGAEIDVWTNEDGSVRLLRAMKGNDLMLLDPSDSGSGWALYAPEQPRKRATPPPPPEEKKPAGGRAGYKNPYAGI